MPATRPKAEIRLRGQDHWTSWSTSPEYAGVELSVGYVGEPNPRDVAKQAIDRGQETLAQVLALQAQVAALTEKITELQQLAMAKRGWLS